MASDIGEITGSSLRMRLDYDYRRLAGNRRPLTGHVPLSANHMTAIVKAFDWFPWTLPFPGLLQAFHRQQERFCGFHLQQFPKGVTPALPRGHGHFTMFISRDEQTLEKFSSAGLQIFGKTFVVTQLSSVQAQISPVALKLGYKSPESHV